MKYFCCDERRRSLLKGQSALNGIDFLEVLDDPNGPAGLRQRRLYVYFVLPMEGNLPTAANFRIEGGERIDAIGVVAAIPGTALGSPPALPGPDLSRLMVVEVDRPGDFSTYTLRLVKATDPSQPPDGFDRLMSAVGFSFKAGCSAEVDCNRPQPCAPMAYIAPEINYLAKDYASFKQLMLDRMAVLLPQWQERHASDLGITLVELLAYAGDYLSYQQDAVATEAYLHTARRRVSVKRHTRLVDYPMHDGCNARAWIHLRLHTDAGPLELKKGEGVQKTRFFTRLKGQGAVIAPGKVDLEHLLAQKPLVFEALHDLTLRAEHNAMRFHTWGARACCLPKGATTATLSGHYPHLKPGHVLILAEVRGARSGRTSDADPSRRQAVRLIEVTPGSDPLGGLPPASPPASSPPGAASQPVTEIGWHPDDALTFALCISSEADSRWVEDISLALGNIVLADHGMTFVDQDLPQSSGPGLRSTSLSPATVPQPDPALTAKPATLTRPCVSPVAAVGLPRFRPRLLRAPLTQAVAFETDRPPASARAAMQVQSCDALPQISLRQAGDELSVWQAQKDLLGSGPDKKEFVVEVESDGSAHLRFGDDRLGSFPPPETRFLATYRIGNGVEGNLGSDSLAHMLTDDPSFATELDDPVIQSVCNPLPAAGGVAAETMEQARQYAPQAFRVQKRAVTPQDYADMAQQCAPDLQRAAATPRWTGSWRTIFVTADRKNAATVDDAFKKRLQQCLEPYRMAGHDLHIDSPLFVSLELEMAVCLRPGYLVHEVRSSLLDIFSNRLLPDGRRGLFHPDNFTFGQSVYLSPFMTAAQNMEGVASVTVAKFQRQGATNSQSLQNRRLDLARREIARLDNDPNFPERGVFRLHVEGGR